MCALKNGFHSAQLGKFQLELITTSSIYLSFQIYYCKCYEKYLKEYGRRHRTITATGGDGSTDNTKGNIGGSETTPNLEASILMDDIMNNVVH